MPEAATPDQAGDIRISVALVTRNRPGSLERTLKSLRAQEIQPWEIIVSDDSAPDFAAANRALAESFKCRYLEGPRRGLYANRNFAAGQCSGSHVRTMDDDHEFPQGHLPEIVRAVETDPAAVWTIGEYDNWSDAHLPGPPCGEIQPRGFSAPPSQPDGSMALADGAAVYPAHVLAQHRMIDCFLFGKSYLEFGARLKASGIRIRHLSGTYIIHHMNEIGRSYDAQLLDVETGFLAAALTYGVYFPSASKSLECWVYFTALALKNSLLGRTRAFRMREWRTAIALYGQFRRMFREKLPFDSIRLPS